MTIIKYSMDSNKSSSEKNKIHDILDIVRTLASDGEAIIDKCGPVLKDIMKTLQEETSVKSAEIPESNDNYTSRDQYPLEENIPENFEDDDIPENFEEEDDRYPSEEAQYPSEEDIKGTPEYLEKISSLGNDMIELMNEFNCNGETHESIKDKLISSMSGTGVDVETLEKYYEMGYEFGKKMASDFKKDEENTENSENSEDTESLGSSENSESLENSESSDDNTDDNSEEKIKVNEYEEIMKKLDHLELRLDDMETYIKFFINVWGKK